MMEKKKRVRPTWTQVKELEQKVADLEQKLEEQTEALHERCAEADGWREKYREKEKEADFLREQKHELITEAGEAVGLKALAEQKLAEQTEALHDRCVEADGWREKYRELKARLTEAEETQNIGGEPAYVSALRRELERVMRRNQQLSDEVKESTDMVNKMRMEKGKVAKLCDERLEEIIRMKNRGLWARIWNK